MSKVVKTWAPVVIRQPSDRRRRPAVTCYGVCESMVKNATERASTELSLLDDERSDSKLYDRVYLAWVHLTLRVDLDKGTAELVSANVDPALIPDRENVQ